MRIALSREGVYRVVGGRTTTEQRGALGAKRDGTLSALIHTGVAAMTTHNNCPEQFTFPARHMYAADTIKVAQDVANMDMIANTFMRAPGESVGSFALECAVDELAERLKIDPIELRRRVDPIVVNGASDLTDVLPDVLGDGDLLLMMGAGDIGHAAQQIAANGFAGGQK